MEEPLQLRLEWFDGHKMRDEILAITLRTPGADNDLIHGLLYAEGIIQTAMDINTISMENEAGRSLENQWVIRLAKHCRPRWEQLARHLVVHSACGLCGKTSLQSLELKDPPDLSASQQKFDEAYLYQLPSLLLSKQQAFIATGGMHASALFDDQHQVIALSEDVGRHNALDKLVGQLLLQQKLPAKNRILIVSGRASFELVQKSVMAGIPILAAIGAPSSLAIKAAQRFGMTLIGFLRDNSFNVYHGEWRIST